MTQENLEEAKPPVEEKTEPEVEPTVRVTETPEFRKELDKALGKGLESTNRQLSLQQTETKTAKAESEVHKATLAKLNEDMDGLTAELDKLADERFADDPEARKGYKQTKSLELREKKANLRDEEQNRKEAELEGLRWAITMHTIADEIQKESNVPRAVLENCTSEEQMRKIAESFPKVGEGQVEVEVQKFDSGKTEGKSGGLTAEQLGKMSPEEQNKRTSEIAKLPLRPP